MILKARTELILLTYIYQKLQEFGRIEERTEASFGSFADLIIHTLNEQIIATF